MRSISVCSAKSEEFEGRFTTSVAMIRHQPPPLANLPAPSWALVLNTHRNYLQNLVLPSPTCLFPSWTSAVRIRSPAFSPRADMR